MNKLYSVNIQVGHREKEIAVFCDDVTRFDAEIDILTTSAFQYSYAPTPRSVFGALNSRGVSVRELSTEPMLDLRNSFHVWLSKEIAPRDLPIHRIGCVEFQGNPELYASSLGVEHSTLNAIRAYFCMLELADIYGIKMETIALPLVGSGVQGISTQLLLVPLIDECVSFLKKCPGAERIYFVEKNPEKAAAIVQCLQESLLLRNLSLPQQQEQTIQDLAFISYSSRDKNIADNLCAKLESNGIKVWYAPRDCADKYSAAIVQAIRKAQYFIVILSRNSLNSHHVLNEVCLGLEYCNANKTKFKSLRIDDEQFPDEFKYYLACQHWMDANSPPIESRLNEFVSELLQEAAAHTQKPDAPHSRQAPLRVKPVKKKSK